MSKLLFIIAKIIIAVVKNKLNANHRKRKREDEILNNSEKKIEILNNYEKKKSEMKVEIEKIEESKINSDIILHNNYSEETNDHMGKKNKKLS